MYPKPGSYFGSFVKEQVTDLEESGIKFIKVVRTNENLFTYIPFFLKAFCCLVFKSYDLVHAHYGFHSALPAVILKSIYFPFCSKNGAPLIVTYHRGDALEEPKRNLLYCWLQAATVKRAAHIIAISREIEKSLVSQLGARRQDISVISCGVDTSFFTPSEDKKKIRKGLGLPEDKPIVLFVGSLSQRKGVDILYKCANALQDVVFVLIGEGPGKRKMKDKGKNINEQWAISNEQLAMNKQKTHKNIRTSDACLPAGREKSESRVQREETLHITRHTLHNCLLVGPKAREEIPRWLNAADMFLLPARSEGVPVSLMEALACGVPAVTSSVGGIPELMENGKTGWMEDTENVEATVNRIRQLLADRTEMKRMSEYARQIVTEKADRRVIAEKIEETYRNVSR
jgi:glycosyltransferase involved in cell wall biosynthesis